jgi:Tfp pilus assembly protein PilX
MTMPARRHPQHGATLVVALIFLVLMSLFAVSAFNNSNSNLRVVGNMQARQEAIAAAQVAIQRTISSAAFSTTPDAVAANPIELDIDANGVVDYVVRMTPQPGCFRAKPIKTMELDPASAADLACMKSGAVTTSGLEVAGGAAAAGNSLCSNSEWDLRAEVVDATTGVRVAVHQGVAVRVLETDAANACK